MNHLDIFNSNAFGHIQMTNAVLKLPRPIDDLRAHLRVNETPIYTKQFTFDVTTRGLLDLVPVVADGGVGDILKDDESSEAQSFDIPTFVRRAYLRNDEVDSARLPGADTPRIVEDERNKKLQKLTDTFWNTKGVMLWSSAFGKVIGVDKNQQPRVIFDTAKKFGLKTEKLSLVYGDSKRTITDQLVEHKVKIERKLGFKPAGYKWFLTEGQHKILRETAEYKQLITPGQDVRLALADGREKKIYFAENVEVVLYNNPYIDETKAVLVPIFDDMIRAHNGKSSSSDFNVVLPVYVQRRMMEWNLGLEMRGEMKHICFFTRVDCNTETELVSA